MKNFITDGWLFVTLVIVVFLITVAYGLYILYGDRKDKDEAKQ